MIGFFTNLFYYQRISVHLVSPNANTQGALALVIPVGGGLIVGLMARFGSEQIRGHGIPEAMERILINGSNVQGAWQSCDYYGVPGKGVGIIEGTVKDKDGGPVAGAEVKAFGNDNPSTTTGADGYYAMQVKPGSYRIVPSGGPHGKSAPNYVPKFNATTIADGASGTADFKLLAGIELELHFDKSTVAADGLQVVNGTVTTPAFNSERLMPPEMIGISIASVSRPSSGSWKAIESKVCRERNSGDIVPKNTITATSAIRRPMVSAPSRAVTRVSQLAIFGMLAPTGMSLMQSSSA